MPPEDLIEGAEKDSPEKDLGKLVDGKTRDKPAIVSPQPRKPTKCRAAPKEVWTAGPGR